MEGRVKFWSGWIVDGDFLIDPAGNHYHRDEIRAIFFNRQLTRELRGSTLKVRSLKQELERKISETQAPVIILQWPDREVKLAYPYSVVK